MSKTVTSPDTEPVVESTPEHSRFDLEQYILQCWSVTDDLKLVGEQNPAVQDCVNALATVYEMRFNRLWDLFEKMTYSKQIR
jgi:hypothetical protein